MDHVRAVLANRSIEAITYIEHQCKQTSMTEEGWDKQAPEIH